MISGPPNLPPSMSRLIKGFDVEFSSESLEVTV